MWLDKQQFADYVCHSTYTDRGMPVQEAELLYMQEVEKMEGYGQESFQAKVNQCLTNES